MIKKYIKYIVIVIILFQIMCPTVFADWSRYTRESGPEPPPSTPDDSSQTQIPSNSDNTEKCYTEISGKVVEDLGKIKIVNPKETAKTNQDEKENELIPIKGVIVNLYNQANNRLVSTTQTDSEGKYSFKPSPGTYYTEFWYGDTSKANFNDKEEIQNILRYNGYDYMTVKTPSGKYIDSTQMEVMNSGKGALQVYLAIDCSYSMRVDKIDGKPKLEYITDAAEKLCNSLIGLDDNIYIGLVFFSGTSYRAVSLTKNITVLKNALEDIKTNDWYTPNTDILGAINKVRNSFYNNNKETSNRYMVLLSDGIPTSDGKTMLYNDDTDSEIEQKIKEISKTTKDKVKKIKEDGVNVITLFTKSDYEEENQMVNNIFKENSNIFENIDNINSTVKTIENQLSSYIAKKAKNAEKNYTESYTIIKGYEDEERRKQVDNIFLNDGNVLNYRNTIIFDQIQNYNNTSLAKKLSDTTKMKVIGGKNYTITRVPTPPYKEIKDSKGNVIKRIQYVEAHYDNQDVWLAKRPEFLLCTSITATQSQIILSNGEIYKEEKREAGAGPNDFILHYIDNEKLYGSKVEIEYTINIKNNSSIQCDYLEVLVQVPEGFGYKDGTANYPTERVSVEDLINNNLVSDNINKQKETLKITLNNNGKGNNGFYISPGGDCKIKLTVSRIAGGLDDKYIEEITPISAEVLQYKNSNNIRTTRVQTNQSNQQVSTKILGVYPGDGKDVDFTKTITNSHVTIIPPTGENKNNYNKIIVIVMIGCIALNTVIYKMRKNKRRTKK